MAPKFVVPCRDGDCEHRQCLAYRTGYEDGFNDGFRAGAASSDQS